ncbi:MAG: hypothetical protein WBW74_21365 [Xanthobacteraceae bacterium]
MKPFPLNSDLLTVAARVVWFEPPQKALADPIRFLAYLMAYGTSEDIALVERHIDPGDLREALKHAPPGIIDARSWAYWNVKFGRYPVPPMPRRVIPETA